MAPPPAPGEGGGGGWMTPLLLRVPRGLAAVVIVGVLALIAVAYWVGHSRGESKIRKEAEQLSAQQSQFAEDVARAQNSGTAAPPRTQTPTPPNNNRTALTPPPNPTAGGAGPKSVLTPGKRQVGLHYFLLMTTDRKGSDEFVQFLKDNQVEAGAFLSNNGRFYEVYALRGFPKDLLASKEREDYEAELKRVGRRWKALKRGNTDLSDMAPRQYRGETKPQ